MRGLDRKKIGLLAVAFVLTVGLMEFLALKLGPLDLPLPGQPAQQSAVAETAGG